MTFALNAGTARVWELPTRVAIGIAFWSGCILLALLAAGVHIADALRVLMYLGLFAMIPGYAIIAYTLRGPFTPGSVAGTALCLGLALQILLMLPLWAAGALHAMYLLPAAAIGALLHPQTQARLAKLTLPWQPYRTEVAWASAATILPILGLWAISINLGDRLDSHHIEQVFGINSLQYGWPAKNVMAVGVAYSNNFAIHLWMLGAIEIFDVDIFALASRSTPIILIAISALSLVIFCRNVFHLPWWAIVLAIVKIYAVIGWPPIAATVFLTVIPRSTTLVLSPLLGFVSFFMLLLVLHDRERHEGALWGTVLAIFALVFFAAGARGVAGPIIICALAFLLLVSSLQRKTIDWTRLAYLGSATAGMLVALVVFFSVGQGFSGTSFLKLTWQPVGWLLRQGDQIAVSHWLLSVGIDPIVAGSIAFGVIALFQPGFLLPGFVAKLWLMTRERWTSAETLLLGSAIAGISAVFLTEATGGSQYTFIHYSNLTMSILGAMGLCRFVEAVSRGTVSYLHPGGLILGTSTFILLTMHLSELPRDTLKATPLNLRNLMNHGAGPSGWETVTTPANLRPGCSRHERAYPFFDHLSGDGRPVILFIEDGNSITRCHTQWWAAKSGAATLLYHRLNMYASWPGELAGILRQRLIHYENAMDAATEGNADLSSLSWLARDLSREGQVYFVVTSTVNRAAGMVDWIEVVAENDDLVLWKAVTNNSGHVTEANTN